ncbi:MAG: hypothetical protein ACR5LA_06890 [Wolbachia sp.]
MPRHWDPEKFACKLAWKVVVKTQRFDDYEKTGSQCRSTGMTTKGRWNDTFCINIKKFTKRKKRQKKPWSLSIFSIGVFLSLKHCNLAAF